MSKLAGIRAYQNSGYYAGDLISFIKKAAGGVKKLIGKGSSAVKGLVKGGGDIGAILGQLGLTPNGGGAAAGGGGGAATGVRRRSRGITARELRGYRKVANLLHREGMVSRKARGRK